MFAIASLCNAEPTISKAPPLDIAKLVSFLDARNIAAASNLHQKSSNWARGLDLFIMRDVSGSRYGADKTTEDDHFITLEGSVWVRAGDELIDGLDDGGSFIKIHKKTMRIIEIRGSILDTRLLN